MASNWPAAIDHFTNPSPMTPMNQAGDPHSKMHGDAFDAITAIEESVGASGGIAALDGSGHVPVAQVPDLSGSYAALAAGKVAVGVVPDLSVSYAAMFGVQAATGVAATDKANINAAIAKANASGGIVWLRAGTYVIDDVLTPLATSVEIRGQGPNATILRSTSLTADFITCASGASLIGVRDLQLDGEGVTRTAGSGINFTNCTAYIIDNVRFIDPYNCGTFTNSSAGWLTRIKVAHGTGVTNRGFWWQSCIDTHLAHVLINGGTAQLGAGLAWLQFDSGCDTVSLVDCGAGASSGSGIPLYLSHSLSPASYAPRWVKVTNCYFEGSSAAAGAGANGVQIDNAQSAYFTNCYVSSSNHGFYITGGTDIKIKGCIIQNCWLRGATISSASTLTDVHLDDCSFDSNSNGANGNVGHLYVGGTANSVRVRDSQFSNDRLGNANKPLNAIEVSIPIGQNLLASGNRFEASAYTGAIIGGTVGVAGIKLRDNAGYNPVGNIAAPAVPASGTPYTNAFGVDCTVYVEGGTVSAVAVAGVATGATSGALRVPTGSTITLTYTAAPTWTWFGD